MSKREREEFIAIVVSEGMPLETARLILRDAATIQRLAVDDCNRGLTESERVRDSQAMERIAKRVHALRGERVGSNWRVVFQGDPRGACVKLKVPSGRNTSFGGEGLVCVPTRRF